MKLIKTLENMSQKVHTCSND